MPALTGLVRQKSGEFLVCDAKCEHDRTFIKTVIQHPHDDLALGFPLGIFADYFIFSLYQSFHDFTHLILPFFGGLKEFIHSAKAGDVREMPTLTSLVCQKSGEFLVSDAKIDKNLFFISPVIQHPQDVLESSPQKCVNCTQVRYRIADTLFERVICHLCQEVVKLP